MVGQYFGRRQTCSVLYIRKYMYFVTTIMALFLAYKCSQTVKTADPSPSDLFIPSGNYMSEAHVSELISVAE